MQFKSSKQKALQNGFGLLPVKYVEERTMSLPK